MTTLFITEAERLELCDIVRATNRGNGDNDLTTLRFIAAARRIIGKERINQAMQGGRLDEMVVIGPAGQTSYKKGSGRVTLITSEV